MNQEKLSERRNWLFIILAGLFITNAVTAELISNKLIQVPIEFNLFGSHLVHSLRLSESYLGLSFSY